MEAQERESSAQAVQIGAFKHEAFQLGVEAAKAAASWTTDGNADVDERRHVLELLREGDPQAFDYLPRYPDLSGEFADDPTPLSLARKIVGDELIADDLADELADAFEQGVAETFEAACETELIRFTS